ncbi:hypothetical protein CI105_04170 [Candidatus Izimaplasma bacterium ZiA1]|uniref:NusG domain II-containing protein n=1 Tax=Candidatus Izimoplasma sp. ZiA1 TaxID=2024899 RepID=UPI000BAA6895|nr:hypothetical protein CI105_04170 [Candidatus Izimaplasma bacterium ZiA1]
MRKSDFILIIILGAIALILYFGFNWYLNSNKTDDGTANVYYNDNLVLVINLADGTYEVIDEDYVLSDHIDFIENQYVVTGQNGPVVIQYKENQVRVIDEISPKHICQSQGFTSSPLLPLTCLPNKVVIIIKAASTTDEPDIITG